MAKFIYLFLLMSVSMSQVRAGIAEGKQLFYERKGTYGSCVACHAGGGSSGNWDSKAKAIDQKKGKTIPSLKGIASRRSIDQVKRLSAYYAKEFGIQLNEAELNDVVMWLYMANK